jgi:hypothetical membrane protein
MIRNLKMQPIFPQLCLKLGIVIPVCYFLIQAISAPFYPGYSFFSHDASTLGAEGSNAPIIFNLGAVLLGVMIIGSSFGFLKALRSFSANLILAYLVFLVLFFSGIGNINAGIFPLPDPRHTEGLLAALATGMIILPLLLPIALWKILDKRSVKTYFLVNLGALASLAPIGSGLIQRWSIATGIEIPGYQNFLNHGHGALQRIVAFITLVPIAVAAGFLLKKIKNSASEVSSS